MSRLALADWQLAPNGNWVSETPTAIGVSVDGVKALSLTCADGKPLIYANGYPAISGANRQDSFSVVVGNQTFTVSGEHSPSDGLWTGVPSAGLIAALKKGRVADVTPSGQPRTRLSLKGSSKAIDAALTGCAPAGGSAGAGGGSNVVLTGALIADACGGDFQLADGAELTGLLDEDDKPDIVLDWAGVTCADRSKGRGAGFCGINMCTIEVFMTKSQSRQQVLGLQPQIVSRAFGKSALRTLALGRSCPGQATECFVDWRWTGSKLEPVR
ncbi:hypothetical protein KHP62_00620 [Rhodobacteraceae bacterium NNCM2]|nr:hypothetical protein [Coraliihabitans acroporae]